MWFKAAMFLLIGLMSGGLIIVEHGGWRLMVLLALCVWGFCRAYYFAFYVIEHWVDPSQRFNGLGHFGVWAWRRWRGGETREAPGGQLPVPPQTHR
jgi:hypothetical protein